MYTALRADAALFAADGNPRAATAHTSSSSNEM